MENTTIKDINEEDPNYPPIKPNKISLQPKTKKRLRSILKHSNELIPISLKTNKSNKTKGKQTKEQKTKGKQTKGKQTKGKNIKKTKTEDIETTNTTKQESLIEWGLGVEHEFMVVFKDINTPKELFPLLEILNKEKLTEKQKQELTNLYKNHNIFFVIPFSGTMGLNYVNIEQTDMLQLPMFEIKNMKFHNVTLNQVMTELDNQLTEVLNKIEENIKTQFNTDIKVTPTPFGAHHVLFQTCKEKDIVYGNQGNGKFECLANKNLKFNTDHTGSYHFWITLPHIKTDNITKINAMHQKAISVLQAIEPLLCSLFGSTDPNIIKNNNTTYLKGSYRAGINNYASFGTSPASMYDFKPRFMYRAPMFERSINISIYKPKKIGINMYQNDIHEQISSQINTSNNPDYPVYKYSEYGMGADFRRKDNVKGFEFRIWDHLPQIYIKDILKITYLLSCYSTSLNIKNMQYSIEIQEWNNAMRDAIMKGYLINISPKYIQYINKQLNLKINNKTKNNQQLLENIIDIVWDKVMKNEPIRDMYLLMTGDDTIKPKVININKQSQEFANKVK